MNNTRVWIFRFLVLAVGALLVYSWFQPWWHAIVEMVSDNAVVIHPWGLETNLQPEEEFFILGSDMPGWFASVMWIYLGIVVLALLSSLFVASKEIKLWKIRVTLPGLIIGLVGFTYIVVVTLAVVIAAIRTGDFYYMKLIGYTPIDLGGEIQSSAIGELLLGYWLACAAGPLLILLALLRKKIIGNRI